MRLGVCNIVCPILDVESHLPSTTYKWSFPRYGSNPIRFARLGVMCWFVPVSGNQSIKLVKEALLRVRLTLGCCLWLASWEHYGTEWPKELQRWHLTLCPKKHGFNHYWESCKQILCCQLLLWEPFNPRYLEPVLLLFWLLLLCYPSQNHPLPWWELKLLWDKTKGCRCATTADRG